MHFQMQLSLTMGLLTTVTCKFKSAVHEGVQSMRYLCGLLSLEIA